MTPRLAGDEWLVGPTSSKAVPVGDCGRRDGSTVGLVTVEDAIEQLTGELNTNSTSPGRSTSSGTLLLDGGVL